MTCELEDNEALLSPSAEFVSDDHLDAELKEAELRQDLKQLGIDSQGPSSNGISGGVYS